MTNYQILVMNKSGDRQRYFLFAEVPQLASKGQGQVFQNAYMTSAPVPSGSGGAHFAISKDHFAITGTNAEPLGGGVTVGTTDWEIARVAQGESLGSTVFMTAGPDGTGAEFDDSKLAQTSKAPGSFTIITDGSFAPGNGANQFIGLGGQDPLDPTNIIPVAVFVAEPNTTNVFYPKPKYYISSGEVFQGQVIDRMVTGTPAEVDFTGKAANLAKVTHNNDGTWSVTFN